ncbi:MAG: GtrA family protein [Verrucomicrobiales bacterium]|nr:GtrA family protein [Verrucomicrobiales bacterium]
MQAVDWQLAGQFGGFLVVGALTTGLDFLVYNLLARRPPGWSRVAASLVSCTIAMGFSFTVNGRYVFDAGGDWIWRAVKFLLVTATSSYLLQSLVIHALSHRWTAPVRWAQSAAASLPPSRLTETDVVARNFVKAVAVGVGLLWNFAWYRGWVFA